MKKKIATIATEVLEGNKSQDLPLSGKYHWWIFTYNNYTRGNLDLMLQWLDYGTEVRYWINEEEGEITHTKHLQGTLHFKNVMRYQTLRNKFPIYWKPVKSMEASITYCCKSETRIGINIVKESFEKKLIEKKFKTKLYEELYDWQKQVLTIIEAEPDDRIIHWFWEPVGCSGKTTIVKYILKHYNNATYSCACKSADILSIADEDKNIYMLNFTRTQEGFAPYTALEQLKDGLISDSKLKKKSINIIMDPPHVIVFANWPPDQTKLSEDRWRVVCLENVVPMNPYGGGADVSVLESARAALDV